MTEMYAGLAPELVSRISRVLEAMTALGFPMKPVQGFRTVAQQAALYAQGRTAPGRIVTYCDGVLKRSNHQSGRAIDCAFVGADPFGETQPWKAYGAMVEAVGLTWGGGATFLRSGLNDRPHAELA